MSAKKGDLNLLLPGADGWEIWTGSETSGFTQHSATEHMLALDVTSYPSGPIQMALPVRQVSAMPFRAQTTDLSLLSDLAAMHLEKCGARPALDGGQLTDHFVFGTSEEEALLTAVVLSPPQEGQLPRRSPAAFDLSARCLPLPAGDVAVWKELGRWVFAIGRPGQALYFQCLSGERLDDRCGNDVRLALTQLQLQGLLAEFPSRVVIWTHGSVSDARPEEVESFTRGVGLEVQEAPRPVPTWPSPPSKLLPADVRAERMHLKNQRNRNILIAVALVAYLGLVGYLFYDLREVQKEARLAERNVASMGSEANDLTIHKEKWEELQPVVESDFYPLELFLRTYRSLPNTKDQRFIRLTSATLINQFKEVDQSMVVERKIILQGQAEDNTNIPKFSGSLTSREDLSAFVWNIQPEVKDRKSGLWTFLYEGDATQ
ncbi:hypothetical protein V2O64_03010 [Verrucomicrobiaceae bacterium 227]